MRSRPRHEREGAREGAGREPSGRRGRSGQREASGQRARKSGRVHVPKIQYRFIKGLEERGVDGEARTSALAMADKIKRYPLEAKDVMGSWERFTTKAIDDFKQRRGNDAEHDRQHVAYAVVFSALREKQPVQSVGDLKQRIEAFSAAHSPAVVDRSPEARGPRQQELLDRERPLLDRQLDATIQAVRTLAPPLRASIEASARDLIIDQVYTPRSAREALPDAVRALQSERSDKNTVHTMTLAVIARTPEHRELVAQMCDMPIDRAKDLAAEGRRRLETYPPLETGLADVRKAAVAAAVHHAISPSPQAAREAMVLAHAREELECQADPKRMAWQSVGDELARDLL